MNRFALSEDSRPPGRRDRVCLPSVEGLRAKRKGGLPCAKNFTGAACINGSIT